eukprot:15358443-Ditylum_brightwellii.AAC.1
MPDGINHAIKNLDELLSPKPSLDTIKLEHVNDKGILDTAIAGIYLSKEIDMCLRRKETYQENMSKVLTVIIGQCRDLVTSKLESKNSWKQTEAKKNTIELLK